MKGAQNFLLDFINKNMTQGDREEKYCLHCLGGYRSVIAVSTLRSLGFGEIVYIDGGLNASKESGAEVTKYQDPSTML